MKEKYFRSEDNVEEFNLLNFFIQNNKIQEIMKIFDLYEKPFINYIKLTFRISKSNARRVYVESFDDMCLNIFEKKFTELTNNSSLRTYLFQIGYNKVYKDIERDYKKLDIPITIEPYIIQEWDNKGDILKQYISKLEDSCIVPLNLFWFEGRSDKEIAHMLKYKNADAVKAKRYKCMNTLKKIFKRDFKRNDF